MRSVQDVLKHELLLHARVVAGKGGLHRQVLWVHNAGVPDAPQWVNGGELVMTTMLNMPDDPQTQQHYILEMCEKDVAALVLTVGRYIERVPQHLIDMANTHDFPLIALPFSARFVDIAKAINEQIAQDNLQMMRRALHIHQALTNLVLQGGGLADLARQLADLIGHSISIETERFDAMATHNIAEVDEARRYTQIHGRTDPRLVSALEARGILPRIRQTLRPAHLEAMPDVGLEMERILAPIVVHGAIYGYMWIIADDHRLTEIDLMAIESGSTIAALMLLYQESMQSAEANLKGSLLSQLIKGDSAHETILNDQSLRYGVDLRSPFVMLIIECNGDGTNPMPLYRSINRLIMTEGWQAVTGQFGGQLIVLLPHHENREILITGLQAQLTRLALCGDGGPRIGISTVQQGAECVRIAYEQCRDVLHIMWRLQPQRRIVHFDDLGYLHTLYRAGAASLRNNPNMPILRRLLDEKQADLFHTLEAYLDAGGNGVSTAEILHIHRSTLNYRLQRIGHICEVDLQDPLTRTNLQIAIKLLRLFEVPQNTLRT